jgi:hypothetical protein
MKVTDIFSMLDYTLKLREMGRNFVPMFSGDAGLGKSQICQAWVKEQRKKDPEFGFIDLRLAYLEAPDFIGPVRVLETAEGPRVKNILHDRWPNGGRGLLLIEEPNRANDAGTLNALMQLLTDRAIDGYTLPEGWVIASCVNPDNGHYDVINMDTALRDRFEIFNVTYDKKSFVKYMEETKFDDNLISFVESGQWVFKPVEELGSEGVYIAPRTWSRVNELFVGDLFNMNQDLFYEGVIAKLGKGVGTAFYKYVEGSKPLTIDDFKGRKKAKSLLKLKDQCEVAGRSDLVNQTMTSVVKHFEESGKIDHKLVNEIAAMLTGDLSGTFLRSIIGVYIVQRDSSAPADQDTILKEVAALYPNIISTIKVRMKGDLEGVNDATSKPEPKEV